MELQEGGVAMGEGSRDGATRLVQDRQLSKARVGGEVRGRRGARGGPWIVPEQSELEEPVSVTVCCVLAGMGAGLGGGGGRDWLAEEQSLWGTLLRQGQ